MLKSVPQENVPFEYVILPVVPSQVERPVTYKAEVEAVVAKRDVEVASVNKPLVNVPRAEKND